MIPSSDRDVVASSNIWELLSRSIIASTLSLVWVEADILVLGGLCRQTGVRYVGLLAPLPLHPYTYKGKQRPALVTRAYNLSLGSSPPKPRMSFVIFTTFQGESWSDVHPVIRGMCLGVAGDVTPEETELGFIEMKMGWSARSRYGKTTCAQYLLPLEIEIKGPQLLCRLVHFYPANQLAETSVPVLTEAIDPNHDWLSRAGTIEA